MRNGQGIFYIGYSARNGQASRLRLHNGGGGEGGACWTHLIHHCGYTPFSSVFRGLNTQQPTQNISYHMCKRAGMYEARKPLVDLCTCLDGLPSD